MLLQTHARLRGRTRGAEDNPKRTSQALGFLQILSVFTVTSVRTAVWFGLRFSDRASVEIDKPLQIDLLNPNFGSDPHKIRELETVSFNPVSHADTRGLT